MAGYIIAEVEVTDPAGFEEYRRHVPDTLAAYGGRFLVRGGSMETLEGDWDPKRVVVLEFDSVDRAREWWSSSEYAEPKALRQAATKSRLILVEGA